MTDEPALRERAENHLAALQKELAGRVRALRLETPDGAPPCLHVTARTGRTETFHADVADGDWWIWGPSVEPIGPAEDTIVVADRLLGAFSWLELKPLTLRLPASLRWELVRARDGLGLRVDAGGRMWTIVTIADDRFWALIEPGTVPEPVGPISDADGAADCVARMLGVAREGTP